METVQIKSETLERYTHVGGIFRRSAQRGASVRIGTPQEERDGRTELPESCEMVAPLSFFCFASVADQLWVSGLLVCESVLHNIRSAFRAGRGGPFCWNGDGPRDGDEGAEQGDSSRGAPAIRTSPAC